MKLENIDRAKELSGSIYDVNRHLEVLRICLGKERSSVRISFSTPDGTKKSFTVDNAVKRMLLVYIEDALEQKLAALEAELETL